MFRGTLSWLGWLVAGLCLMGMMSFYTSNKDYYDNSGGVQEKYHSLSTKHSDNKIAVIDASGIIMSGDGFVKKHSGHGGIYTPRDPADDPIFSNLGPEVADGFFSKGTHRPYGLAAT